MPNEGKSDRNLTHLVSVGDPVVSEEHALDLLKSRADLSYYFFEGLSFSNAVARQSLFHGALFRNCKISDSDFSRCDFEGARFENCELTNVSFETADIRSTKFANSKLISCTMRSSVCANNTYKNCLLDECEFDAASVLRCIFDHSLVRGLKNRTATWLHTTFTECQLERIVFSDCTVSYTIYDRCSFEDVTVNADAIGFSFGLTVEDLQKLKFGFLGKTYDSGMSPSLDNFLEQYRKRNWLVHSYILSLNFNADGSQALWLALLNELASQIASGSGAKHDDVEFVFRVMSFLRSKQRLPFSTAVFAHDLFSELDAQSNDGPVESQPIQLGLQNALFLATSMYEGLLAAVAPILDSNPDELIEATFIYKARPVTATVDYVGSLATITSGNVSDARLLDARQGSWVEIVQLSLGSLFAFYVALYLVNGCLAQLTMVRARSKKLFAKRLPPKFLKAASDPASGLPRPYQETLQKLLASQLSENTEASGALKALTNKDVEGLIIDARELNT